MCCNCVFSCKVPSVPKRACACLRLRALARACVRLPALVCVRMRAGIGLCLLHGALRLLCCREPGSVRMLPLGLGPIWDGPSWLGSGQVCSGRASTGRHASCTA
jgi:hypothetical protein